MTTRFDVERAVAESALPPHAKLIMLTLAIWTDNQTAAIPPESRKSLEDIEATTGLSHATVLKNLDILELAGWLTRKRSKGGRNIRTGYRLLIGAAEVPSNVRRLDTAPSAVSRTRIPANPERAERSREYATAIRDAVFAHYGIACACCGSDGQLTIDHVVGDGKEHRASMETKDQGSLTFYRWLISNGFPAGFQVLCRPCNSSKGRRAHCTLSHPESGRQLTTFAASESGRQLTTSSPAETRPESGRLLTRSAEKGVATRPRKKDHSVQVVDTSVGRRTTRAPTAKSSPASRRDTGVRLPEDWKPSPELMDWAYTEYPQVDAEDQTDRFKDYWLAKAGAGARHVQWDRTWKNWIRRENDKIPSALPPEAGRWD